MEIIATLEFPKEWESFTSLLLQYSLDAHGNIKKDEMNADIFDLNEDLETMNDDNSPKI